MDDPSQTTLKNVYNVYNVYLVNFALSWGVGALVLAFNHFCYPSSSSLALDSTTFAVITCAPSIAALIVAYRYQGLKGLLDLLRSLYRPFHWAWLIVSILIIPFVVIALSVGFSLTGVDWPVSLETASKTWPIAMLVTPLLFLNIAPFGEELGWRGFALPNLLSRHSLLFACLILGAIWTVWHIPAFFLSGTSVTSMAGFVSWTLGTFALTLTMSVLYVRANGNIVVAGIIPHMIINSGPPLGVWNSRFPETVLLAIIACICYFIAIKKPSIRPPVL